MKKLLLMCSLILFSMITLYSMTGDTNNDGVITIVDALLTAQYFVGLDPQNFNPDTADVNESGNIDIIDALLIAQYYVGIITEFPVATQVPTDPTTLPPTPPPSEFTPIVGRTPTPVPGNSVPFAAVLVGALPMEMGNRDHWHNCVISGNYVYMTSEVSLKIFDISEPQNPVFAGFCEILPDSSYRDHSIIINGNYAYVSCETYDDNNLQVIDISDPASPAVIRTMLCPRVYSMELNGNYLYVNCYAPDYYEGIYVVDVTQPDNPVIYSEFAQFHAWDIACRGSYAYIASSDIHVYDISDPHDMVEIHSFENTFANDIFLSGDYMYLAGDDLIEVYDITAPASPVFLSSIEFSLTGTPDCVIRDNLLYCVAGGEVLVIDISDPMELELITSLSVENANSIDFQGSTGYLVCGITDDYGTSFDYDYPQKLAVYDFSDPLSPAFVTEINGHREITSIKVSGNYAYLTDKTGPVKCINISDPANPILTGSISLENPQDLQIRDNYLYIADGTGGFKIVDISNPAAPVLIASLPAHDRAMDVYLDGQIAYVADQAVGVTVIDISNPYLPREIDSTEGEPRPTSSPAPPTPTPTEPTGPTPTPLGTIPPTPGPGITTWNSWNLVVKDNAVIVGTDISPEIKVLSTQNLEPLSVLDPINESYDYIIDGFHLDGNYLYFVLKNNLFRIMDTTDLLNPVISDGVAYSYDMKGNGIATSYPYAFLSSRRVYAVNIADPYDIFEDGHIVIPGMAGGIAYQDGYLYIPSRHTNYELIILQTDL